MADKTPYAHLLPISPSFTLLNSRFPTFPSTLFDLTSFLPSLPIPLSAHSLLLSIQLPLVLEWFLTIGNLRTCNLKVTLELVGLGCIYKEGAVRVMVEHQCT